ncbi:RNA dependent RNA polymerase-domain-containing protein [Glomus cerebriforme]|uniref:RNA-dependent RNA polymerase n=1 Tax=Glomus cerebriforme TaxID=658196 RepID=A0A397SMD4_9GLOM|nr:RNA dependent RNA polymerase-domain-containing protein [Glomus cerebriforme]
MNGYSNQYNGDGGNYNRTNGVNSDNVRNRNNGYDDGDRRIKPPRDWRNFSELKFRVSNAHIQASVTDLVQAFSAYGDVHRVEIVTEETDSSVERPTGLFYVIFKPVPSSPFWDHPVRFHGRILQVNYQRNHQSSDTFIDQSDKKQKLKFHSFQAESLEMGDYQQSDTFVSEIKFTESIKYTIDYQKRRIIVEFCVKEFQEIHMYKLEINFKDIKSEIYAELNASQRRSLGTITIENKYPAKYWVLDKKIKPKDNFNWCKEDSWKRITKIRTSEYKNELPLNPNMPNNSEQPGKWLVFRLTLDLGQIGNTHMEGLNRFKEMMEKAGEYNLASKPVNVDNKPLKIVDGSTLRKYLNRSMLNFDVLYMVESNISFNYLNDYNLNEEFFTLLSRIPTLFAVKLLESIYSRKKRLYDPLSYLRSESRDTNRMNVENKPKNIPSQCAMMRKVVVTPTTMYVLTPTIETSNRVIRYFRDKKDHFLRVQFVDEALNKVGSSNGTGNTIALYDRVYYTLKNGIKIGDRHYEFLAFSASQLRDHSCWFFAPTKDLTADGIRKWMGDFSTNKSVAKYAARMGQCFSSTRVIQRLLVNDIKEIPDVIKNGHTFSDGVGNISFSLAKKIAYELESKTIPSAFQFRLAGYKGVLCQSNSVRENQIQVRPSQHKFESQHHILEVIRESKFISAYLNRQAIALLSALGISDDIFIEMKNLRVSELDRMLENENTAMDVLQKNVDEYGISASLADLVKAGFLRNKDRYLMNLISLFRIMMLRDIKKKAKIRVDKGAFLLGVLDVTETLKENQVYCCVSDPNNPTSRKVITGRCIVFRNPCFHPGDIRIVTAVECKALSHLVDVLVFPAVGKRDIPSQCSGGDLDGDDFTIMYDERLIPPKVYEPMNYEAQKPKMVDNVTMDDIKTFFVKYIFSDRLGMIANAHLAKADFFEVGALHGQCIRLAQLHSDAVDFPKTGRPPIFPPELRAKTFPDFMEKPDKPSYESSKVLGIMYRSINVEEEFTPQTSLNFENFDERLYVDDYELYLDNARKLKREYDADIRGLMNQFGIMTEVEVTSGYIVNAITKVDKKKPRDIAKSVMDALAPIKRHYRKLFEEEFYEEGTNVILPENRYRMESKAYAWYYVAYHPVELCDDSSENMISFPWILHDILCDIAIRNNNKVNVIHRASTKTKAEKNDKTHIFSNGNHAIYEQDPFIGLNDDVKRLNINGQNGASMQPPLKPIVKTNNKPANGNGNLDYASYNQENLKQSVIHEQTKGIYHNINTIHKQNGTSMQPLQPIVKTNNKPANGNGNLDYASYNQERSIVHEQTEEIYNNITTIHKHNGASMQPLQPIVKNNNKPANGNSNPDYASYNQEKSEQSIIYEQINGVYNNINMIHTQNGASLQPTLQDPFGLMDDIESLKRSIKSSS